MQPYKKPVAKSEPLMTNRFLRSGAYPHIEKTDYLKLKSSATNEYRLLLELLWVTAGRISEILDLRASDLVRRRGVYSLSIPRLKRKKQGIREAVPISLDLAVKIEDYIHLNGRQDEERLFDMHRATVFRYLKGQGRLILGHPVTPHMFRHGRIYELVKQGVQPLLIAKIVGHASIQTTLGYFHPTEADIRQFLSE